MEATRRRPGWSLLAAATIAGALAGGLAGDLGPSSSPSADGGSCPAAAADGVDLREVIAGVRDSVVSIDAAWTVFDSAGLPVSGTMAGSGFVIDADGLVATNAHVVSEGGHILVTLPDGSQAESTVVGIDEDADLAVLDVHAGGLTPVRFGCSGDLRPGDPVVAVGNALGLGGAPSATAGIVAALDREITTEAGRTYTDLVQVDVAISEGQSGGPLLDAAGKVVGITSAGLSGGSHVGFAIGIDEALPVLARLTGGIVVAA